MVPRLGEVLWIVDLNRQSLDRVVPDIAAGRIAGDVRGGRLADDHRQVRAPAARAVRAHGRRGAARADRRDDATRSTSACCARPADELRERLPGERRGRRDLERLVGDLDDAELVAAVRDLGGHDLGRSARRVRARPTRSTDRPSVDLRLHDQGVAAADPGPPGQPLGAAVAPTQWEQLAGELGADAADPWARVRRTARPRPSCAARRPQRLQREPTRRAAAPPRCPPTSAARTPGSASTQQAFGRFFVDLAHAAPEVAARVVTVSPDVASSTNLGGWINHVGVWNLGERIDWFADDTDTLVRWRETEHGQHIELGIAEGNLVGLLGELGRDVVARRPAAAADRHDLRPVRQPRARAVVVRHLRRRAVDPRRHAVGRDARARGRRAPVDHHAVDRARAAALRRLGAGVRPGPRVDAARTRSARLGRPDGDVGLLPPHARGRSTRRSPRVPEDAGARERAPAQVLAGGYALRAGRRRARRRRSSAMGAVHARGARRRRRAGGRRASPSTSSASPRPTSSSARCRRGRACGAGDDAHPRRALPGRARARRSSRCSTATRTRSRSSSASAATPIACLGVDDFGQSGDVDDLYRHFGIDAETIVGAALDLTAERKRGATPEKHLRKKR